MMKHEIKMSVEECDIFEIKKAVVETHTIKVGGKPYKRLKIGMEKPPIQERRYDTVCVLCRCA